MTTAVAERGQLSLLDTPVPAPRDPDAPANHWEEAYRKWITQHPEILGLYERIALRCLRKGKKFSISLLTERIRWRDFWVLPPGVDGYRLNNNFRAYIARDLIARTPRLAEFLRTREVHDEREEGIE